MKRARGGERGACDGSASPLAIEPRSGPPSHPGDTVSPRRPSRFAVWTLRLARFPMIVGILSIFVTASALLVFSAVQTWRLVERLAAPGGLNLAKEEVIVLTVKLVDVVLIATVLHIMAIGLYSLFIDSRLPVPPGLRIDSIDALKQKLNGVIVTVLGVLFLEQVVAWDGTRNLLPFGIAVALVVAALSLFLGTRPPRPKGMDEDR